MVDSLQTTFYMHFVDENNLKFHKTVHKSAIDNKSLASVLASHLFGAKPLSEAIMGN